MLGMVAQCKKKEKNKGIDGAIPCIISTGLWFFCQGMRGLSPERTQRMRLLRHRGENSARGRGPGGSAARPLSAARPTCRYFYYIFSCARPGRASGSPIKFLSSSSPCCRRVWRRRAIFCMAAATAESHAALARKAQGLADGRRPRTRQRTRAQPVMASRADYRRSRNRRSNFKGKYFIRLARPR